MVTTIAAAAIAPVPWQNGGGTTRHLLADDAAGWRWRISLADIDADGDFSAYDGTERWFAVVEGDGVVLDIDGVEHRLTTADAPLRFDGARPPRCRLLGGATRDLNLMLRRGARGVMTRGTAFDAGGWPLCGRYDSATATLHWPLPSRAHAAAAASLWIGIAP